MKKQTPYWRLGCAVSILATAVAWSAIATPAYALEVSGVNFTPTAQTHGITLTLLGAGVRRLAANNLYTAALYLEHKPASAQAIWRGTGAKQLRVVLLRDVNSREISNLLSQGFVSNSNDDELAAIIPEMVGLGTLIAEQGKLFAGDSFQIDWSQTAGTTISIRSRVQAQPTVQVFGKPDLVGAMMKIWLGDRPADAELKSALLGKTI